MNIWTLCLYEGADKIKSIYDEKLWKDWIEKTTTLDHPEVPSLFLSPDKSFHNKYETVDISDISDSKEILLLPSSRFSKKEEKGFIRYESFPLTIPENSTFIPIRINVLLVYSMFAVYKSIANSNLDSLVEKANTLFNLLKQHNSIRLNIKGNKGLLNHYGVSIYTGKTKSTILETPPPDTDIFETGKCISKRAFLYSDISWIGKGKIKGKDSISIVIDVQADKEDNNPFIAMFDTNIYDMVPSEEKYIFGCYSTLFVNICYTMEM